ncbi:hypothetical protein [Sphingobium nicotianae]|uniref:Uncharacterized protein n=1 Tax=Sphingobium nicotianae TaxID=2782607 RepID=A0A9X1D7U7_9SPHN|nr:hypothetical protein [Sphingobium nicotianae]MBT2185387.1 hypothetical protein [Sphingobium nicotianae]
MTVVRESAAIFKETGRLILLDRLTFAAFITRYVVAVAVWHLSALSLEVEISEA